MNTQQLAKLRSIVPEMRRVRHIHFVGIGGAGMGGIAEVLANEGYQISGSDLAPNPVTQQLMNLGATIYFNHRPENVRDASVVVVSSAISADNPEIVAAHEARIPVIRRAEMLAELMRFRHGIAIAGTHGKTTTTSMASYIFLEADMDPTISVGGILDAIGGNIRVGQSETFLTEACEYTNSFLSFFPTLGIILNMDADHLDFFKDIDDIRHSFRKFAELLPEDGTLIINADTPKYEDIIRDLPCKVITYGLEHDADYQAADITYDKYGHASFSVLRNGVKVGSYYLKVPGIHNVSNALAAIALGHLLELPEEVIIKGLGSFTGTDRRFQYKGEVAGVTIIDDYAHHPTAIKYVIEATRVRYPGKKIVAIFQPDRFSRGARFAKEFAQEMDKADYPYFCPFPENAKHEDGIDIDIYDISKNSARAKVITEDEAGVKELMQYDNCVFLFMSSKDIYKFEEMLIEAKKSI